MLLALLALLPASAAANPSGRDRAAAPFQAGVEAYRAGRFDEAAGFLVEAYTYDPNPRLAFNAGRAWERASDYNAALEYFLMAADSTDDAELMALSLEGAARMQARVSAAEAPREAVATQDQATARVIMLPLDAARADRLRIEEANAEVELPARVRLPTGSWVLTITDEQGEALRSWRMELEPGMTVLIRYSIDDARLRDAWQD